MKKIGLLLIVIAILAACAACGETQATLVRIEVDSSTLPDSVTQDETIDLSQAKLTLYYSDGTTERIDLSSASMDGNWDNSVGRHEAVFYYKDLHCAFYYTVEEKAAETYTATIEGIAATYEIGDEFAPAGVFVCKGITFDLSDYADRIKTIGFETKTEGEKTCTLQVSCSLGEVTVTYHYVVNHQIGVVNVAYMGEKLALTVGDSNDKILGILNKEAQFLLVNEDQTSEYVYAQSVTNCSTAEATADAVCSVVVRNKSHVTATVSVPYSVRKIYAPVTVTFDLNYTGAASVTATTQDGLVKSPEHNRKGYYIAGWTCNGQEVDLTMPIENEITLVAIWQPVTYTVSFVDCGNLTGNTLTYNVRENVTLPTPTLEGCTFDHYIKNGTEMSPDWKGWESGEFVEDMTLAAVWEKQQFTITYDLGDLGGTSVHKAQNNAQNPANYLAYDKVALGNPTRDGYTFDQWLKTVKVNGETQEQPIRVIEGIGDVSLRAVWKANDLTITKVAMLGDQEGEHYVQSEKTGEDRISITMPDFAEGYRWDGWYSDAQCKTPLDKTQSGYYFLPATLSEDVTIYAKLSKLYTVTLSSFDGNETVLVFAEGDENNNTYRPESNGSADSRTYRAYYRKTWKTASERNMCDLLGWVDEQQQAVEGYDSVEKLLPSALLKAYDGQTLRAQWQGHAIRLLKDYNGKFVGGKDSEDLYYTTLDTIDLGNLTVSGYTFLGWTLNVNSDTYSTIPYNVIEPCTCEGTVTVYAQWRAD